MSGSGRLGGLDGEIRTAAGDATLQAPGTPHDYGTAPGSDHWELVFAHFHARPEWLGLLSWPQPVAGIGFIQTEQDVHARIVAALFRASRGEQAALRQAELFAVNALEEGLLWCDTQNPLTSRLDERVLRVIDFVDTHLAATLTVDVLARHVHLSESRLAHLFAAHVGTSPQRYVERQRITRAKQLLDLTNRSVAAIANDVGWQDALYFSKRFKQFTGQSPTEYRRRT